jgi:hypothetical protein
MWLPIIKLRLWELTIRIRNTRLRIVSRVSLDSSVGIATGYGLDDQGGGLEFESGRVKNVHFSISSRPALGFTQSPIKWVPGALSRG